MDAVTAERSETVSAASRHRPSDGRARRAVGVSGAVLLLLYHGSRLAALGPDALNADLGVQHYLGRVTAQGAIPLIDFEHGWNTGSWYFNAALQLLSGGNPTLWLFLWGVLFGPVLAGVALLVIAGRLRLPPAWMAALLAAWVVTIHLPHSKYAVPMVWALILLPIGRAGRRSWAIALRVGMTATVFWFHAELAVLLGAGTAMYDVFGAREHPPAERLARLLATGGGLLLGLGSQIAVYAVLGLAPGEVLRQVITGQTDVFGLHFNYPLFAPSTFRMLVYPASLVLPFVPALWRSLSESTRFIAFLHLGQALVPIRRPGDGHVGAAATLLALLVVLVLWDVAAQRGIRMPRVPEGTARLGAAAGVLGGATWFGLAIAAGFRVESLVAIVLLCVLCLVGVVAAAGGPRPWASIGAMGAAVLLLAGGFGLRSAREVSADAGLEQATEIAAATASAVERCAPERQAWVVPSPLMLYETLGVENPTPFHHFWYTLEAEHDRVQALVEAGRIPTIIQPYGWPESLEPLIPYLESRYEICDEVLVESTGNLVRFWRFSDR
jgi:hypothetical protein